MRVIKAGRETRKAVRERRLEKALKMIRKGHWTIRRAATFAQLSYHEILDKMAEYGVDSGPSLEEVKKGTRPRPHDPLTVLIGKKPLSRRPLRVEELEEMSENR